MAKRVVIAPLIGVMLVLASCAIGSDVGGGKFDIRTAVAAQYRKISPQMAKEMIDSLDSVIILDVRTENEYAEGHIPGAILIPNETIETTGRPQKLDDLDAMILVYCRSGNRSAQAARKLSALGYTQVYDFGGIIDWPYEISDD